MDGSEWSSPQGAGWGAFALLSPVPGWVLAIIADDGTNTLPDVPETARGWEHVSVHARNAQGKMRVPTWKEMCFVKDHFWGADDTVVQYHPRQSVYVNHHPFVLHLWRHREKDFPVPPTMLIA
jgi:hypothetical protein